MRMSPSPKSYNFYLIREFDGKLICELPYKIFGFKEMKFLIFAATLLVVVFITRKVDTSLSKGRYPDLSCHAGYDVVVGKEDADHTERLCANRTRLYPEVCMSRCLLVQIGVLKRRNFEMATAKEIATSLVNFAFEENQKGKWGALQLGKSIVKNCLKISEEVAEMSKNCKHWEPLYECVDKVWACN